MMFWLTSSLSATSISTNLDSLLYCQPGQGSIILKEDSSSFSYSQFNYYMGLIEKSRANYPLAYQYILNAASSANSDELNWKINVALFELSIARGFREDVNRFKKQLTRWKETAPMAEYHLMMAKFYHFRAINKRAADQGLRALIIAREDNNKIVEAKTLNTLAKIYFEQGLTQQVADCARLSIAVHSQLGAEPGAALANLHLSKAFAYRQLNDSARHYIEKAVFLARKNKALHIEALIYFELHEQRRAAGDFVGALSFYKQYDFLSDSLENLNKAREIDSVFARDSIQKSRKENSFLRKEAELREGQLRQKTFFNKVYGFGLIGFAALIIISLIAWRKAKLANDKLRKLTVEINKSRNKLRRTSRNLKKSNETLIKIQQDLLEQKDKAERASKAKDTFLSSVSHELRTPLNAILGLTEELLNSTKSVRQRENLEIIRFSGDTLLSLVNDILDFNKIEAGQIDLEYVDFNLRDHLEKLLKAMQPRARKNKVNLFLFFDHEASPWIKADPVRLGQIVNNLLSNAVKFTNKGRVELRAEFISKDENSQRFKFSVIDEGIGIPEDKLEHIFERFKQASVSTTRKYGGTGLGLAISKRLVELFGGELNVKSKENEGSVFSFEIDLAIGQKLESHSKPDDENLKLPNGLHILLAEDNRVNQKLVSKTFIDLGINVDIAENGKEAIEALKRSPNGYDIILMDLHMPEMDGIEAVKEIRKLPDDDLKNIPIIALSGSTIKESEELKAIGLNAFLQKPFKKEELFKLIARELIHS